MTYRNVSAIPEDAPKFDDDKFANSDEEAEDYDTEVDFEEELEEEYA